MSAVDWFQFCFRRNSRFLFLQRLSTSFRAQSKPRQLPILACRTTSCYHSWRVHTQSVGQQSGSLACPLQRVAIYHWGKARTSSRSLLQWWQSPKNRDWHVQFSCGFYGNECSAKTDLHQPDEARICSPSGSPNNHPTSTSIHIHLALILVSMPVLSHHRE